MKEVAFYENITLNKTYLREFVSKSRLLVLTGSGTRIESIVTKMGKAIKLKPASILT